MTNKRLYDNEICGRDVTIVGLNHYGGVEEGKMYELKAEPNNQYDTNAIMVLDAYGNKVGYVKAGANKSKRGPMFNKNPILRNNLNKRLVVRVYLIRHNRFDEQIWCRAVVERVEIEEDDDVKMAQRKENMALLIREYNHYAARNDTEMCNHIARLIKALAPMIE